MFDFEALDIVECIDDEPLRPDSRIMPRKGKLYTVDAVRPVAGRHSVRLIELAPECSLGGPCECGDCGWDARRFRRVFRPRHPTLRSLLKTRPAQSRYPFSYRGPWPHQG